MAEEPEFYEGREEYDFQARPAGTNIVYERRPRNLELPQAWQRIRTNEAPTELVVRAIARFAGASRSVEPVEAGILGDLAQLQT